MSLLSLCPWLDRRGRVSALRLACFALLCAPGVWMLYLAYTGAFDPEPLPAALHESGKWAVRGLLLALAVTPLRWTAVWPECVLLRRMIGLSALAYAGLHVALYVAEQGYKPLTIVSEIALRFYLTIGFVAFAGMAVLGWTSTDAALRRMGKRWKRLHRLIYPITALALFHHFLQGKIDVTEATLSAGLFLWLMGWRLLPAERRANPWVLLAMAPVVTLLTAGLEYAWYALATRLPAERIAAANLDWAMAPRPVHWVLLAALGMVLVAFWRRSALARPAPRSDAGRNEQGRARDGKIRDRPAGAPQGRHPLPDRPGPVHG
ncbi:sulfoxide reductase heme-binding subunit YedZ [Humitalea rosea]|uniref:Protein-methionine-sulfoxide reductase heme-binding subunit MsrQ n=1 Tax=Humitalea rosea TaxID=990373 RepID=A0A2W7HZU6_9PROT|nr:protein-methionine-sulfoxide reductase heme-binding subunit MsrQ [Humitalea rosea]PZW40014.1 sulfoxide reductase heme-binding subunit YedZ [Humitalea rosea]